MQATESEVQPGQLYGVPGITQRYEQYDTTVGAVTALALGNNVSWNNVNPFQKTDVVHWWEMNVTIVNTGNTGTLVLSPMAPYNYFQNLSIQMQGQYKPIDVVSGFDAALFQLIRPMRGSAQMAAQPLLGTAPSTPYANANIPDSNRVATPNQTTSSTPVLFTLELPASLWFDQYWDLAEDGTVLSPPIAAYVSPQYMGGGERVVQIKSQFAAATAASNADQGPITGGTTGTTANITIDVRRIGVYASTNPAEMPPVFNWQYYRHAKQIPIGAAPKFDLPITDYGQILAIFVRLFDPTSGVGVPGNLSNVTKCQVLYGSNLPRFDDTPVTAQKRFLDQHGFLPPQGTMIWDMALTDTGGYITNAKAINTLTNANVKVHLEWSSAMGASAYASLGLESLVYVSTQ